MKWLSVKGESRVAASFLGAFAKLQKATTVLAASCLSACLSVPIEQRGSHWTDFREI